MEENIIEKTFGKNAMDRMLQVQIAEFVTDEETKKLFNELCDIVSESDESNEELIEKVFNLPYNIGHAILSKAKGDRGNLIGEYREKLFKEFLSDANNFSKKGISKFERRFLTQPSNVQRFLKDRILTRYELEVLFDKVSKYTDLKDLTYKEKHEYKGDNVLMRQLSSAHAVLTSPKQSRARDSLFHKVKKSLLADVINKIKELNVGV